MASESESDVELPSDVSLPSVQCTQPSESDDIVELPVDAESDGAGPDSSLEIAYDSELDDVISLPTSESEGPPELNVIHQDVPCPGPGPWSQVPVKILNPRSCIRYSRL